MKKMKTKNKCLVTGLAIIAMLMMSLGVKAQNVTIRPDNGNLIVGQAGGNIDDSGIKRGLYSMWRHEQLPLTMTTSDIANLSNSGELADPSCAIGKYNGKLILAAGQTQTFIVVSLPKGYRITGYKLVLQPLPLDVNVKGPHAKQDFYIRYYAGEHDDSNVGNGANNKGAMAFFETPAWSSGSPYGNNTHSQQLTCNDKLATAAAGNDTQMDPGDTEKEFVIQRNNITTNQLHFFFARSCSQYGVYIKSFELWFTAQGTFEADVTPITTGEAVSKVSSPFPTSKMDVGKVLYYDNPDEPNRHFYYYDFTKVRDLIGYNALYQKNAVNANGVPDDVASPKHIYPVMIDGKGVYAFGNDTYFVEPPVSIYTSSGVEAPIGFRVVGAKFDCQWANDVTGGNRTINNACRISYGNRYLNENLDFVEVNNQNPAFVWQIDDFGNIYTGDNNYKRYLACFGEGNDRILSYSSSANGDEATWNLRIYRSGNNNYLRYVSDSNNPYYLHVIRIQEGGAYHYRGYVTLNQNSDRATAAITETETITIPDFHQGSYTLKVYGTDASENAWVEKVEVNGASDAKEVEVKGLNNDAIMFKIEDLPDNKQAIVHIKLLLEALNPYIDKMDIVCHDIPTEEGAKPNLELTQSFSSNDFSVSGGKFVFYVPEDYSEVPLEFTFSDLYSKYGDNTYYYDVDYMQMNGNARYSFVTSEYFKLVSGNQVDLNGEDEDDVFPINNGLYNNNNYSPDSDYKTKVFTSTAGNVRFKFNNAENLGEGENNAYLKEYPFSVTTYLNHYPDPDWKSDSGTDQEEGDFIPCILIADVDANPEGKDYKKSDIFYVFTADETRYNIAPSTGWQHRYYAFYRMDIELEARTFTPDFTLKEIYPNTLQFHKQVKKDEQGNVIMGDDGKPETEEVEIEDSMWGLELNIEEKDETDPSTNEKVKGYFTYQEIIDKIQGRKYTQTEADKYNTENNYSEGDEGFVTTENWRITPVLKQPGDNSNAPKYMRQILYVDGTALSGMFNSSEKSIVKTLQDLKDSLAVNNLVFLPINTTSTLDNTAFKTLSGSFRAGKDIVLTDKEPFYSPYDITVDAAHKATYTRVLTQPGYGQAINATIVLPFTLSLEDEGEGDDMVKALHKTVDKDGNVLCTFTVNSMVNNADMTNTVEGSNVNYGTAYFTPLTEKTTVANIPYMINVKSIESSVSEGNTISFIATQYGSGIAETPLPKADEMPVGTDSAPYFTGKLIRGNYTSGKFNNKDYYFTSYASYSGGKFDRAASENVFYFAKDMYLDLHTLYPSNQRYLMSYPFRGAYIYDTEEPITSGAKMMKGFFISYDLDDMQSMGIATDLDKIGTRPDLMIRSDRGLLTITASRSQDVIIRSVNGMVVKNTNVEAGNTTTVALPAGIYLVNNTKITVK